MQRFPLANLEIYAKSLYSYSYILFFSLLSDSLDYIPLNPFLVAHN